MARMKYVAMILAVFAFITGCSGNIDFFNYNLFTDLGVVKPVVTATYPAAATQDVAAQTATLATLNTDLSSPAYLAALTADTTAMAAVQTYLQDVYTQPAATPQEQAVVQEAAVLYADLNLDTSGGTTVVQNIVETLMAASTDTTGIQVSTTGDIAALLMGTDANPDGGLLPAAVTADVSAFTAFIEGMVNANDAYGAFAATLTDPTTATVPETVNMGDVAQKALVSYMVSTVVDLWIPATTVPDPVTGYSPAVIAAAAADLYAFLSNPEDPASPQPTGTVTVDLTGPAFTGIANIFTVAGVVLPNLGASN